jgi:hypothetical protein
MNLIEIWKAKGLIFEGIKNKIFKQEHIEEIAEMRMKICEGCEFLGTTSKSCVMPGTAPCCSKCGCSLTLKTKSLSADCPAGKWATILTEEEDDKLNETL